MVNVAANSPATSAPESGPKKRSFLLIFIQRNRLSMIGYVIMLLILLIAFVGPFVVPEVGRPNREKVFAPPESGHWLGFDNFGRDIWSQIVHGGRDIILVAAAAALLGTAIGVVWGALAAMVGGFFETVTLTLSEIVLTVPGIVLLGVLAAFIRLNDPFLLIAVLAATSWPVLLMAVRAQVLSLREREYVEAARMLDLGTPRILFTEILPNMASYIIINFVFHMTGAIYGQVILYFLGLVSFKTTNWGMMIQESYKQGALLNPDAMMMFLAPIFMIVMLIWSLTLIARSLEDVFNPRLREI